MITEIVLLCSPMRRSRRASLSAKGARYFREDSICAEGSSDLSDIKDLEANNAFEMLALDG